MRLRIQLCLALLSVSLPLLGETARLLEPRDGVTLRGGDVATLDWSATSLPEQAEEWEAFLSVDDGDYYAYRITPHLRLERRSISFDVPNVDTSHARILIRVGNEERETEIALPARFSIVRDSTLDATSKPEAVADEDRGEAARPGERGVIEWGDGDREGGHLEAHSAVRSSVTIQPRSAMAPSTCGETALEESPTPIAFLLTACRASNIQRSSLLHFACVDTLSDILLATTRMNV
jgi:hypothetical protein